MVPVTRRNPMAKQGAAPARWRSPCPVASSLPAFSPDISGGPDAVNSAVPAARACLKIPRGAVFEERAGWRGATRENTLYGSSTEEQRSQAALFSKTLRAAGLLSAGRVGSVVTAHYGDAPPSPPSPHPKSLAAAPLAIFRQALR